jgi:hypothetical protein
MNDIIIKIRKACDFVEIQHDRCIICRESAYQQIKGIIKLANEILTEEEIISMTDEFQRKLDMYSTPIE